jgi:DNA-binding XRE family transcriptional regulator
LAKLLGVTHQAVNNWEMGHSLPNKTIMPKLCDILKITPKRFYE